MGEGLGGNLPLFRPINRILAPLAAGLLQYGQSGYGLVTGILVPSGPAPYYCYAEQQLVLNLGLLGKIIAVFTLEF